jgi:hypothetical protein
MIILILIWLHFIADFLLQSDKMALNKSTSFKWLTIHAITYGLPFFCWFFLSHGLVFAILFTLVNAILHCRCDYITCDSEIVEGWRTTLVLYSDRL